MLYLLVLAFCLFGVASRGHGATSDYEANEHHSKAPLNQVVGTWSIATANITTNGSTSPAFGPHPVGILIFAETLYFSELISVDPATLPRFSSDTDRTSGTPEQNAAVVAGTLGQIGTYTVDDQGLFQSETFLASTFPDWIGLYRNTTTLNETAIDGSRYLQETLHDVDSDVEIRIFWKRVTTRASV